VVEYSLEGDQGVLVVRQEDSRTPLNGTPTNEWDLLLSDGVPIDLEVVGGAGTLNLDMSGLDLNSLRVEVGAGDTTIDFSEGFDQDVTATVEGGVGEISVRLPSEMGVQVSADTGIGDLSSTGLVQSGELYVNDAFGEAPNTLFLEISAGVGEIELLAP
jgi:predicted membrane protein